MRAVRWKGSTRRPSKWHARGGPDSRLGHARLERTWNVYCMLVTLEVSQLEMSAAKSCRSWKICLMSVMAEMHQSAMGPYIAMAAVGSSLNSRTALFREP